jgi:sulfur carrier protein ThiS
MTQMKVTVELFAYYRQGRFKRDTVGLPVDATVTDLLTRLEISRSEVGILIINGKSGTVRDRLEMGDRVTLIPIIGGG